MASTGPTVWVVHDGKIGMANQVIGLAEAVGFPFAERRLDIRSPWRHLTPQLWLQPLAALGPAGDRLQPPWPDLLIACGRLAAAPSLAVKRASGGRCRPPWFGQLLPLPGRGSKGRRTVAQPHGCVAGAARAGWQ